MVEGRERQKRQKKRERERDKKEKRRKKGRSERKKERKIVMKVGGRREEKRERERESRNEEELPGLWSVLPSFTVVSDSEWLSSSLSGVFLTRGGRLISDASPTVSGPTSRHSSQGIII